ncbi:hypothetical protein H2200_005053 [Cladophialophora chaetospira]|uniref:BTB domain-containing protein n=1 Tax=Cladophialophora chaetospira TaxID=386627 RepID=A0AA39CJG0_9EURO|nr:hypothetical protein H2200_005053 [Cladophialophora chaetospira]
MTDFSFSFGCTIPKAVPEPPKLPRGLLTIKLTVGPEYDQQEFVVHKDLLCATSKFFERGFSGGFAEGTTQEMKLPEEEAQVFAFFCDWLYRGNNAWRDRSLEAALELWHADSFWLKVYKLGDRIMSPALQMVAYVSLIRLFNSYESTIPSRDFVFSLFEDDSPLAIQMYVVEHVAYWLPKSQNKDDWAQLFSVHERFGMEMALAIVRSQSKGEDFMHPCKQDRFEEKLGFDFPGLEAQARSADEIPPKGAKKVLYEARLLPKPENTAAGVKRSTSQMLYSSATPTPTAAPQQTQATATAPLPATSAAAQAPAMTPAPVTSQAPAAAASNVTTPAVPPNLFSSFGQPSGSNSGSGRGGNFGTRGSLNLLGNRGGRGRGG